MYWRADPDEEEWKPSKKGVTLKLDQAGDLLAILETVAKPARANSQGNFISGTGGTA